MKREGGREPAKSFRQVETDETTAETAPAKLAEACGAATLASMAEQPPSPFGSWPHPRHQAGATPTSRREALCLHTVSHLCRLLSHLREQSHKSTSVSLSPPPYPLLLFLSHLRRQSHKSTDNMPVLLYGHMMYFCVTITQKYISLHPSPPPSPTLSPPLLPLSLSPARTRPSGCSRHASRDGP